MGEEVKSRDVEVFFGDRADEALVSGVQKYGIRSSAHLEECV